MIAIFRRIARFLAGGRTVGELADELKVSRRELRSVSVGYHTFYLRKRSGGYREIQAPADELKRIQRRILRRVLTGLPVHEAACAFERGRSILDNARPHAGAAIVLSLDLVDFFPSIDVDRVRRMLRRCRWGRAATRLICSLCTWEGVLPQGAPTSPRLANLVNVYLDRRLAQLARNFDASYTRYADDITFSFLDDDRRALAAVLTLADRIVTSEGYRLHRRHKLSVRRAHQRQEVTGLVVNDRPRLPRETRRWLRAVKHRIATNRSATLSREQLAGWLAFESMIEDGGR